MTDKQNPLPPPANLALLKGLVWGMGVLLIAGAIGLAVRLAAVTSDDDAPAPQIAALPDDLGRAAPAPVHLGLPGGTLPAIALEAGEQLGPVSVGTGLIVVTLVGVSDGGPRGLLLIDPATGVATRLPVTAAPTP